MCATKVSGGLILDPWSPSASQASKKALQVKQNNLAHSVGSSDPRRETAVFASSLAGALDAVAVADWDADELKQTGFEPPCTTA